MTLPTPLRAALAVAALAVAGCHPRSPLPLTREGEWALARDGATRRTVLYDGFKHRATGTATYLSLAVREARARRLGQWLGWTEQELTARLEQERTEYAEGEEFLLSFYAAGARASDLDAPQSIWRVALKVEGVDVLASRITSMDSDANLVSLFPYIGPFDVAYRVLFPRPPSGELGPRPFVLELASGLGKVTLDYGGVLPARPIDRPWQPVPPP